MTGRIAIIGADGQLGTALRSRLGEAAVGLGHGEIEIVEAASVNSALDAARPDLVINAAAYNFVDRAEDEPQAAYAVNALGPRNLAAWCRRVGATLVHVSSDYVFSAPPGSAGGRQPDSRRAPWCETDLPAPAGAYAVSKLAGEHYVQAGCRRHFVVRTCGLYGRAQSAGKGNFIETMLRLAAERDELRVVDDQRCTPTAAADLADAIAALIETQAFGLYHVTNGGETTWHGFAREIFRQAKVDVRLVPISSEEFGAKAPRPTDSVLDCERLAAATGRRLPPWEDALARYLSDRAAL